MESGLDAYENYKTSSPSLFAYEMSDETFASVAARDTILIASLSDLEADSVRNYRMYLRCR